MLANFKNSFENSSLKIKIELYLLPILCLVLLYVVFDDKKIVENENNQNSELLNIENKKFSDSILELSSKIEEIAKNESIPDAYTHLRAHETEAELVCRLLH